MDCDLSYYPSSQYLFNDQVFNDDVSNTSNYPSSDNLFNDQNHVILVRIHHRAGLMMETGGGHRNFSKANSKYIEFGLVRLVSMNPLISYWDQDGLMMEMECGVALLIVNSVEYYLNTNINTIGRNHDSTIVLNLNSISRNHAVIFYDESVDKYNLMDLDSLNGTSLRGFPLQPNMPLSMNSGDDIRFGSENAMFILRQINYY